MTKRTEKTAQESGHLSDAKRRFYRKADDVAAVIIMLMKKRGWNQRKLAEKVDKPESYVSRVLSGGVNLTLKSIAEFEAALDADILQMALERPEPPRRPSRRPYHQEILVRCPVAMSGEQGETEAPHSALVYGRSDVFRRTSIQPLASKVFVIENARSQTSARLGTIYKDKASWKRLRDIGGAEREKSGHTYSS